MVPLVVVALLIYLLLRARVGVRVKMKPGFTEIRVFFGAFSFGIIPSKPKKAKPRRVKKEKKKKPEKPKKKIKITPKLIFDMLPHAFRTIGRFFGGIAIEKLYCHIVVATGDAAKTAILFGAANAGLGLLAPITDRALKSDVTLGLDYSLPQTQIYLSTALSIRLGTALALGLGLLWRFWRISSLAGSNEA